MTWFVDAAVAGAFYGVLAGLLVPVLIARVPEPAEPAEDKPAYADIARSRGLRGRAMLATGVVGAVAGGAVGWSGSLAVLLFLAPVGVALAVIDWRTRLLPTRLIAPAYAGVVALVLVAALLDDDLASLLRAGWGWLVAGGSFLLLWLVYPRGMGYGDVRLSGVLGLALGHLGWGELLVGIYAGFLLGGVGGGLLTLLRMVDRKAYPFGPFMLAGALVGVVLGEPVAAWYT